MCLSRYTSSEGSVCSLFTFWQSSQRPFEQAGTVCLAQMVQLPEDSTAKHLSSWLKSAERMFPLRPHSSPSHLCCRDLWAADLPQNPPEDAAARRWHYMIVQESHRAEKPPSLRRLFSAFLILNSAASWLSNSCVECLTCSALIAPKAEQMILKRCSGV